MHLISYKTVCVLRRKQVGSQNFVHMLSILVSYSIVTFSTANKINFGITLKKYFWRWFLTSWKKRKLSLKFIDRLSNKSLKKDGSLLWAFSNRVTKIEALDPRGRWRTTRAMCLRQSVRGFIKIITFTAMTDNEIAFYCFSLYC